MQFIYPKNFNGEKSENFSFKIAEPTIQIRRAALASTMANIERSKQIKKEIKDSSVVYEKNVETNNEFIVEYVKIIADTEGFTPDELALFNSDWLSDFWVIQKIRKVENIISQFREENNQ